tara:strand:- start:1528 stop:1779 length:252 start_codon:yes stop_codon:yes gene_type:complete
MNGARDRKDLTVLLEGKLQCDQGAAPVSRLYHHNSQTQATDDPISSREVVGFWFRTERELGDCCTCLADLPEKAQILNGIEMV